MDEGLFIAGAVMVAIAIGVIAAMTLAAFLRTAAPAPMAVAIRGGLVGLLAAQASGVWMLGHGRALLEDDADPLLQSMSTVGAAGSMKFAHAVPMHAIQVLAALAGLLSLSGRSQHRQTQLVALAVVGYGGLFAIALLRTTFGLTPVGWLDASTFGYLLAAALLAAPAAVAITAVTAHSRHAPSPRANPMQPPVTVPAARAAPHRHRRLADPTTEEGWNRAHRVVRDFVDDQDQAKDAQQLYVVPAPGLVLGRLGRDVDDRHWPELLSDLAWRLGEASSGRASMTLDSVLHQWRRPLASDRPSTTRGSRGTNLPSAGDDAVPGRLSASHQRYIDQPEEATMDNDEARRRWRGGETSLGGLLVLLGLVVLAGQAVDVEVGPVGWPVFVIVPGLGLLGLGLAAAGRLGEVLATVGGVVTMAGVVLGVQNATDRFDTWAYAWTLVLLVGAGTGRWLVGVVQGRGELARSGGWLIAVGLGGFLGLAVVFEVIIGIGGGPVESGGRYGLAALLILAGLVLLARRLLTVRRTP